MSPFADDKRLVFLPNAHNLHCRLCKVAPFVLGATLYNRDYVYRGNKGKVAYYAHQQVAKWNGRTTAAHCLSDSEFGRRREPVQRSGRSFHVDFNT